jgi:hypothetical protein
VYAFGLGIDIPNDFSAGDKIVLSFVGHLGVGARAIVALASDFDGERGRALNEPH